MKTITPQAATALAQESVALAALLRFDFSTGSIFLNTSNWNLTWGGNIYAGAFGLGEVSAISDSAGEAKGMSFGLFGDIATIALALDDADIVQGTPVEIRTAVIETVNYTIVDAPVEWTGKLDTMTITEDGARSFVSVTAESRAADLLRGKVSFYNDVDQRRIDPSDGSMRFVVDQIDKPVIWPTRQFFFR